MGIFSAVAKQFMSLNIVGFAQPEGTRLCSAVSAQTDDWFRANQHETQGGVL